MLLAHCKKGDLTAIQELVETHLSEFKNTNPLDTLIGSIVHNIKGGGRIVRAIHESFLKDLADCFVYCEPTKAFSNREKRAQKKLIKIRQYILKIASEVTNITEQMDVPSVIPVTEYLCGNDMYFNYFKLWMAYTKMLFGGTVPTFLASVENEKWLDVDTIGFQSLDTSSSHILQILYNLNYHCSITNAEEHYEALLLFWSDPFFVSALISLRSYTVLTDTKEYKTSLEVARGWSTHFNDSRLLQLLQTL